MELKTQLSGGYPVHLPGTTHGRKLPFTTKYLPGQTVYVVPSSEKAVEVIARLESTGPTEVFLNGPTIEDVFLKVAQDAEIPHHPFNEHDMPQESRGAADTKMSSGEDLTFLQQSRVLFHKRFTILLGSWFPHTFAILIPIAATPAVKTFIANYKPPMCSSLAFANFNVPQPLNIFSVAQQIGNLQILAGPPLSINHRTMLFRGFPSVLAFHFRTLQISLSLRTIWLALKIALSLLSLTSHQEPSIWVPIPRRQLTPLQEIMESYAQCLYKTFGPSFDLVLPWLHITLPSILSFRCMPMPSSLV